VAPAANGTESTDAAVATAAYDVLVALFPDQQSNLQTEYNDSLSAIPDGAAKDGGVRVGGQAAAAMLAARQNDGRFGIETWTVSNQVGKWRPVPPLDVVFPAGAGHWVGDVTPFFVQGAQNFTTAGPGKLTGKAYTDDFNEVKAYGSATSTVRKPDQTDAAIFWHDRHLPWWGMLRDIASTQQLNSLQSARMLAITDLSTADSLIACFNDKAQWNSWRPYTAIREAASDGNSKTTADPNWTPLLVTSPFPEYPSGHACATGTITSTLTAFFGTNNISFTGVSADTPNPRHFTSFSQSLTELINARVWGGVHFRTADVNGAGIGFYVTAYALGHHILGPNG
jgi:hypothetical protein